MILFDHHTQFITITNLNWLPVLQNDYHKQIIIEALQHRVNLNQVSIYAFVIMPNHMHFLWQLHDNINKVVFQRDLLKFTARSILKFMLMGFYLKNIKYIYLKMANLCLLLILKDMRNNFNVKYFFKVSFYFHLYFFKIYFMPKFFFN